MTPMTAGEILAYRPPMPGGNPLEHARGEMRRTGQWGPGQHMGRSWPIGCVALEVTQRCNLDCTLCYLSESSEALKDMPLEEVYRRIDVIAERYGPGTNVQVTGGEPTLRAKNELLAIVGRVRAKGLRPALFTNGIAATRRLLGELCDAGLMEVAFHVDTTQQRPGYSEEEALNELRDRYIARAQGLPLAVYFNTTVHQGNFEQLPAVVRFFVSRSHTVSLASFQLQADTGRGVWGARNAAIDLDSVAGQIRSGAGAELDFGAMQAGHSQCNRVAMALVIGGRVHDALDDRAFVRWALERTAALKLDRARPWIAAATVGGWAIRNPRSLVTGASWMLRKAWRARGDLFRAGGQVRKLTFFIHNFMDARLLDRERIDACVFAALGSQGPEPMCLFNARRDQDILKPVVVKRNNQLRFWNPLTGAFESGIPDKLVVRLSRKTARGRAGPDVRLSV